MQSSAATLYAMQLARAAALPRQAPRAPARTAALEGIRQRNALLDALFYDVGVISHDEAVTVSPWLAAEGALVIVPPSGAGALVLCPTLDDFVTAGGEEIRTLAVAGVGSSALGSAAFARNVADATGQPVAAVVSGYGLADVMTEALGGFFWFGALNGVRHQFEILDRLAENNTSLEVSLERHGAGSPLRRSRDTRTVVGLLKDPRLNFTLLTGHSKGNLVLSEALYQIRDEDEARIGQLAQTAKIVTISARIAMPANFEGIVDVMGAWDWFGGLNSRPDIPADHVVARAWHHTNTELPAHLPVTRTLRDILETRAALGAPEEFHAPPVEEGESSPAAEGRADS